MSITLQELVTKYTFDIKADPLNKLNDSLENTVAFATKVGAAAGAAASAIFGIVKFTADAGDQAYKMSQKIGISVERLQELQYAAKLSDVEAENFGVSMRFLSRNMNDAVNGSKEAQKTFKALGVSIGSKGALRGADEVLADLADKFAAMPDGAQKTAMAMDIFGRSGSDLIPFLNGGSKGIAELSEEARRLGIVMSTDQAKAGEAFNDNLTRLFASLNGVRNIIGNGLLPVINDLVLRFTDFVVTNRELISENLGQFFKTLGVFVKNVWQIFTRLTQVVLAVSRLFGGLNNMIKLVVAALSIFIALKFAYLLGTMTTALYLFITGLTIAQIKAWALNAAIMAIPLAIGALIVLVALLAEDLYTAFTDPEADTFFGMLFKGVKDLFNIFGEFFGNMSGWGQTLITYLLTPIRMVVNAFGALKDVMGFIFGDTRFGALMGQLGGRVSNLAGVDTANGGGLSSALGIRPETSPAASGSTGNLNAKTNITQNIQVGAGSDLSGITNAVSQGTKSGLDESLREASRIVPKKGGY